MLCFDKVSSTLRLWRCSLTFLSGVVFIFMLKSESSVHLKCIVVCEVRYRSNFRKHFSPNEFAASELSYLPVVKTSPVEPGLRFKCLTRGDKAKFTVFSQYLSLQVVVRDEIIVFSFNPFNLESVCEVS